MRRSAQLSSSVALAAALLCAACPNIGPEVCGVSTELPDVPEGRGVADATGGDALDEAATWAPGSNGSVDIGLLSMTIATDETGTDVDQLIGDGVFPICIPLGARSDTSGAANFVDGGFVSDAGHTGGLALLKESGGVLTGRFEVELANGSDVLSFTDGRFAARRR